MATVRETFPFSPSGRWTTRQLARVLTVLQPIARSLGMYFSAINITTFGDSTRWYILVLHCQAHKEVVHVDGVCSYCMRGMKAFH